MPRKAERGLLSLSAALDFELCPLPMPYRSLALRFSIWIAVWLCACHPPPKAEAQGEKGNLSPKTPLHKTLKKPPRLTDQNAVSFLITHGEAHPQTQVAFTTTMGAFKLRLYRDTPRHRANFLYLVNRGYFEGTYFHHVVRGFVDQAGNTDMMETFVEKQRIGNYSLPAEFSARHLHKRGAVSMARGYAHNPQKRSTPFEFFIVIGKRYTAAQLREYEDYCELE